MSKSKCRIRHAKHIMVLLLFWGCTLARAADIKPFVIKVVDEQTHRGVPLIELKTTNDVCWYTDSNGIVAFVEPGVMNQRVFFLVKGHGYEHAADGFGMRGAGLEVTEGGTATIKVKRINIAERLYRITGGGIYRDSVLAGIDVPIREPVLNAKVFGSDSIQEVPYRDKLYWFWGDTGWPAYPLGNFHTTGATVLPPDRGGLDPDVGINLDYFKRDNGFSKEMTPFSTKGPTWIDSLVTLPDDTGRQRLYCAYSNVNQKMEALERGLAVYNDEKDIFETIQQFDLKAPITPCGHPFKLEVDGTQYIYFPWTFPFRRVPATTAAFRDLTKYEAFTCLKPGSTLESPEVERDAAGRIVYAWKHAVPPLGPNDETKLIKAGTLKPAEALLQFRDPDTGKEVIAHGGSVYWNDYRKRWVAIFTQIYGTSVLGELWYAEADTPLGPWVYARKIITHEQYSFYNPKQHPTFAKDGGRVIYFEGTYTIFVSGNTHQTPRYDYNQIMYKLDLADPRLALPVPVYDFADDSTPDDFGFGDRLAAADAKKPRPAAFLALDREIPGAVRIELPGRQDSRLRVYTLPADMKDPPPTTAPLWQFTSTPGQHVYTIDESWSHEGFRKGGAPIARVWTNPIDLPFSLD